MIRRTTDAALVGRIVGTDMAELLAEPLHVCLEENGSVAFFAWRGPETYELHLWFSVKGKDAAALLLRMIEHMRQIHGAERFWALIPEASRHVRLFARRMRWTSRGLLETRNGPCELFVLENDPCLQR